MENFLNEIKHNKIYKHEVNKIYKNKSFSLPRKTKVHINKLAKTSPFARSKIQNDPYLSWPSEPINPNLDRKLKHLAKKENIPSYKIVNKLVDTYLKHND